jgi:hypothetical protein
MGPFCGPQSQFDISNYENQDINLTVVYHKNYTGDNGANPRRLQTFINGTLVDERYLTDSQADPVSGNAPVYLAKPWETCSGDSYFKGVYDQVEIYPYSIDYNNKCLSLSSSFDPSSVATNQESKYTLAVANTCDVPITDVSLNLSWPSNLTLSSGPQLTSGGWSGGYNGGTWYGMNLPAHSNQIFSANFKSGVMGEYTLIATPTQSVPTSAKLIVGAVNANFDAWERTGGVNARNIYTKLASNAFTLSVAQLNSDGKALLTPTKAEDVNVSVVDTDTNQLYGTQPLHFDAGGSNPLPVTFNIPRAIKNAKIHITDSSSKNYDSSDSFAIKPSDFTLTLPATTIKAGDPFDLSAANSTSGYNGTAEISTATYNQSCATKSGFLTTEPISLNFASTPQKATGLIMKDVGDINVTIKDKTWTAIDQYTDCVKDSSSNIVDASGKVGCDIETNTTIKVIPYDINASKTTVDPMWVYRSVNGAPKFNFSFDTNATDTKAQLLKNYSSECFAEDTTVVIDMGITPNTKSLTNVNDVNITSSDSGVTITPDKDKLTVKLPASLFNSGRANATLQINSEKSISTPEEVVKLTATGWTSLIDENKYDKLSTSDNIYFLYGKIAGPNVMVDYASTATVRAYAEVYATDPATLPGDINKWVQAPGSSVWWINMLHDGSSGSIANAVIKNSTVLDSTTNATGFGFSANPPFGVTGGMASMGITMTTDQNKDQKIMLHLDVPSYLWYGSNSYSFATNTDCSQHPCMSVDIFGTISDTDWYGDGDKKGNKTIKTVPKGKRAPKINW